MEPQSSAPSFHISIWPILLLNVVALLMISVFCVLFIYFDGGFEHGISMLEQVIVAYFGGIGFLILLAACWLAWLSGPVVFVEDAGIRIVSTWLMDKTFPGKNEFQMDWDDMAGVGPARFLTMHYLRIAAKDDARPPFYLPLFLSGKQEFYRMLMEKAPKNSPVRSWAEGKRRKK